MSTSTKFILGPQAVARFLDVANKNGELPDAVPVGPIAAVVELDGPVPYGEVIDFKLIDVNGQTVASDDLPSEFASIFAGEVLMRGKAADEAETLVMFRVDDGGEVTAVFPFEAGSPGHMSCYAHIGQHSSCDLGWVLETRAATAEEYAKLKAELEGKPFEYKFEVIELDALGISERPAFKLG